MSIYASQLGAQFTLLEIGSILNNKLKDRTNGLTGIYLIPSSKSWKTWKTRILDGGSVGKYRSVFEKTKSPALFDQVMVSYYFVLEVCSKTKLRCIIHFMRLI